MRLIGSLDNEKKAFQFYSFLLECKIHTTYEKRKDKETKEERVFIWVYEEDEAEKAKLLLDEFIENPNDERFAKTAFPAAPPLPPDPISKTKPTIEPPPPPKKKSYPFTYITILVCVFLFVWDLTEKLVQVQQDGKLGVQFATTKVMQDLMFDYPLKNQALNDFLKKYSLKNYKDLDDIPPSEATQLAQALNTPSWGGIWPIFINSLKKQPIAQFKGPLFEEIKEGQIWRLITPIFLHGSILHILFNMLWAWVLLRQVEDRLSVLKLAILVILIGAVSNTAQYLMTGPNFLGYSGIICGLVGFIWMRQKVAPWEGYPLDRTTVLFILIFVLAMLGIEVFTQIKSFFDKKEPMFQIANTAHIIGGLTGIVLARIPFFARKAK